MPCLRGIEVSLTTRPGDKPIPEYPHPDSSSAHILGDGDIRKVSPSRSDQALVSSPPGMGSNRYPKSNPTVSVYMPSVPGSAFAVNYSVNRLPTTRCRFMFFKLYINGRPMLSWGIEPAVRPKGRVVKSLWAPCVQFSDQVGFEERNFVFLPGQEKKSAAEDGGLIEIQAFRAKARKGRVPKLEEFRYQENYGIAAPSIGLLDRPEEAWFFDYHLTDPKDLPYATFKLHYRSSESLKQLNLIPPAVLGLRSSARPLPSNVGVPDESVFNIPGEPRYDSSPARLGSIEGANYFLKSPPEFLHPSCPNHGIPEPGKSARDGFRESYLQRPLPDLPSEEPSGVHLKRASCTSASSGASVASGTPSITHSLLEYVYDDSFDEDQVEIGVAKVVQLPPTTVKATLIIKDETAVDFDDEDASHQLMADADNSFSDYETSPPSTCDSGNLVCALSPRSGYLPTTGSSFELDLAQFSSPRHQRQQSLSTGCSHLPTSYSGQSLPECSDSPPLLPPPSLKQLSEFEWMSRTPSPVQRRWADDDQQISSGGLRRLWSPRPGDRPMSPRFKVKRGPAMSRRDNGGHAVCLFSGLAGRGKPAESPGKVVSAAVVQDVFGPVRRPQSPVKRAKRDGAHLQGLHDTREQNGSEDKFGNWI